MGLGVDSVCVRGRRVGWLVQVKSAHQTRSSTTIYNVVLMYEVIKRGYLSAFYLYAHTATTNSSVLYYAHTHDAPHTYTQQVGGVVTFLATEPNITAKSSDAFGSHVAHSFHPCQSHADRCNVLVVHEARPSAARESCCQS